LLSPFEATALTYLLVWQYFTTTGDISENSSVNSDSTDSSGKGSLQVNIWRKIASERHFCSGRRCSRFNDCYYFKIRRSAEKSNLIVVNHSLLLTDLGNDKLSKEDDNYIIVDEAHNLPELASEYLGIALSYSEFNHFCSQLFAARKTFQHGILPNLKASIQKSTIPQEKKEIIHSDIDVLMQNLDELKDGAAEIFRDIAEIVKLEGSYGKLRVKEGIFYQKSLHQINGTDG